MITIATVLRMMTTTMMIRHSGKILQHKRQVCETKQNCLIVQNSRNKEKGCVPCRWTHLDPQHCFQRPTVHSDTSRVTTSLSEHADEAQSSITDHL